MQATQIADAPRPRLGGEVLEQLIAQRASEVPATRCAISGRLSTPDVGQVGG
jgi:hypothetical protein